MIFCDTSAVAKLYVAERESPAVRTLLESDDQVLVSELVRAELMAVFHRQLRERKWTQRRAAVELGVSQPRVSHLMGNRIDRFSTDSLIVLLARAGVDVQIRAKPRRSSRSVKRTA